MLTRLRDQIPAGAALYGLKSRQGAIRNACNAIVTRRLEQCEWEVIKSLHSSTRASYVRLFFELVTTPSIPMMNLSDQDRPLIEFGRLQRVARPNRGQRPEDALSELKSMRPSMAAVAFGEALVAIRKGRSNRILRAIATSARNRARPIIMATQTVSSDRDYEGLLQLYAKLNESEIDLKTTPSVAAKAEDLARIIRRLTTKERIGALRQMFDKIAPKPSARNVVVTLLNEGGVDDVTAVLLKVGNFRAQIYFQNHLELCLAAKQATIRSDKQMPQEYNTWVRSRNFWSYVSRAERSSLEPHDLLPVRNQSNRPLFIRLLAHAIVGLMRSSDDPLLHTLLRHDFTTIASSAAIRLSELLGDSALGVITTEIDSAISAGNAVTLASAIRRAEESLYIHL